MLYTVLLFIIILLAVAIYAENIKKSEHFSNKIGEECYGQVSSKMSDGNNGYYSNFMLNTYSNFDSAFHYLKNKSISALNSLNQYKVDLEQAYDIDTTSREALIKTGENVTKTHQSLRNLVANKVSQYDNELAQSMNKLENIKKIAAKDANIKKEEVMKKVDEIVSDLTNQEYKKFERNTIDSDAFKTPFLAIMAGKISTNANVNAYQWQCEPGIIGAPIRINSNDGRIECLSNNGSNCDTNFCQNSDVRDINHLNSKTVPCSDKETTTPGHWCNKSAHTLFDKETTDYSLCPKDWKIVSLEYETCKAPANYSGTANHMPQTETYAPECAGSKCQTFIGMTPEQKMQWSKSTNTMFPSKINIIDRARDMTNVLGQVDNVLRTTMGTGSPPSRIENYKVYKNGVIVKAYRLKEGGNSTPETYYSKGKVIYDSVVSSSINFRAGSGSFMSIRPQYTNPNNNFNTDRIFVVFSGYIKFPEGISSVKFRTISDDGVRFMTKKTGEKEWTIQIDNFIRQTDTAKDTGSISVSASGFLEYQMEFFEYDGDATCVLQWSLQNDNLFDVVPRESFFIDSNKCSKSISTAAESGWKCLNNINGTGGATPLRMNDRGDIECISTDARNCLWTTDLNTCNSNIEKYNDSTKLNPLSCGDMHKSVHGTNGYSDANHWCAKARTALDPSNKMELLEDSYGGRCGIIDNKRVKCLPGRGCNKYGYCGDMKFISGDSTNRMFNG